MPEKPAQTEVSFGIDPDVLEAIESELGRHDSRSAIFREAVYGAIADDLGIDAHEILSQYDDYDGEYSDLTDGE